MSAEGASLNADRELQQALIRQVQQRTWGQIHRLEVEVCEGRVVVHGRTQSYYQKQLVLQAVLDVLGTADPPRVRLDIIVGNAPPRAAVRTVEWRGVPGSPLQVVAGIPARRLESQ